MFRRSLRTVAVERPTNWLIDWCKFLIAHAENNRQGVAYRMVWFRMAILSDRSASFVHFLGILNLATGHYRSKT
jgi:hypothetical protein